MDIGSTAATGFSLAPKPEQKGDLDKAAEGFEAIFLRQMLASARQTNFGSDLFGGQGSETFRQMRDDAFADLASKEGVLGLSDMIEAQLQRHLPQE